MLRPLYQLQKAYWRLFTGWVWSRNFLYVIKINICIKFQTLIIFLFESETRHSHIFSHLIFSSPKKYFVRTVGEQPAWSVSQNLTSEPVHSPILNVRTNPNRSQFWWIFNITGQIFDSTTSHMRFTLVIISTALVIRRKMRPARLSTVNGLTLLTLCHQCKRYWA